MRPFLLLPMLCLALIPLGAQTKKKASEPRPPAEGKAEAKDVEPSVNWDAEWKLLPDDSDKLEPLIEEHVKDLNFAMKAWWKRKLQGACKAYPSLDILAGETFSVTLGKEVPADTASDGEASTWKRSDGETFQVTLRKDGPRMTQVFQGDGYTLTHVYSMRKDGRTLALQVTYSHPKLANPFSYKLVFKRAS